SPSTIPAPYTGLSTWDIITDFQHGTDKIDLSALTLSGSGPSELQWIGTQSGSDAAFGSVADPTHAHAVWNDTAHQFIYADTNGDGIADLKIQVSDVQNASDFIGVNGAPTITSGASGTEPENTPATNIVYQATGTDPDGDTITWSLSGTDASLF